MFSKSNNMESQFLRDSMDFEPESDDIEEKLLSYRRDHVAARISRQRLNPRFRAISVGILIISLLLTIFSLIASQSCVELDGWCLPEVSVKIQETSDEGRKLLDQARAGLRLATYLAKDLAVHPSAEDIKNEETEHISMSEFTETVDTFTNNYTFHFSYNGFCRESDIDHSRACLPAEGLDVLSCLVEDIGLQLGNVSKAHDGSKVAKTLVATFQKASIAFGAMWQLKNQHYVKGEDIKEDAHMAQLKAFHSAKTMQSFAKQQAWLSYASTYVSGFATLLFAFVVMAVYFPGRFTDSIQKHHRTPILVMAFIQFAVQTYMVAGLIYYLHRVHKLGRNLEVAQVTTGSGSWTINTFRFVFSAAVLYFVITLRKKE